MNWEKICFQLVKKEFKPIGNSARTTEFLTLKRFDLLMFLPKQTTCKMKALQVQN